MKFTPFSANDRWLQFFLSSCLIMSAAGEAAMRTNLPQEAAPGASAGLSASLVDPAAAPQPLRRFTVRDSIELSTFLYPSSQFGVQPSNVSYSPDGKSLIAATMKGNLATGKREATLWLLDKADIERFLHASGAGHFVGAKPLAHFSSASNRDPISDWRWSSDSRSVLFLGADDDGADRLYRVATTGGGEPVALSSADQDVSKFDERGGAIVYLAHRPIGASELYQAGGPSLPDMEEATGKSILSLLFPFWLGETLHETADELWTLKAGKPVQVVSPDGNPVRLKNSKLALSPDGRQVVVTQFVKIIPPSWTRFRPLIDYPGFQIVADTPETEGSTGEYRPQQYATIDLDSGNTTLLADAPIEFNALFAALAPQWTADGTRIALPGAYPPLNDPKPGAGESAAIYPCTFLVVDVEGKKHDCVLPESPTSGSTRYGDRPQMVSLRWAHGDRDLEALYSTPNAPTTTTSQTFTAMDGSWKVGKAVASQRDRLVVDVRQGIDQPPVLVAWIGHRPPRPLLDPNPQLADIALGKASLYHWRDATGNAWSGALVTPPDFSTGRRYPLVIQTHQLDRAKFLVDGPSATGFAARALAARGIVVLQIDEPNLNSEPSKESEKGAAGYHAAIEQLSRDGIIDPVKVGIIAWSHYGPYAMQALIDHPHDYAAATFAEAAYNDYTEYLMNIDYMGSEREQMFRAQVGAKPFGDGLKLWLERSAGFHTDRLCTPILWQVNSPPSLIYGWGAYAALRAQNKPIDLFYIRNGEHVSVKPLERLAEQGMNVDWYDYWLNGRKDSDPSKAAQYKRWDAMRSASRCGDDNADPPPKRS